MSKIPRPLTATIVVIACVEMGVLSWYGLIVTWLNTENVMQDWIVYFAAGTAARAGEIPLLFDGDRFTSFQFALLSQWFTAPVGLHPFLYPPNYLLLLAPMSRLPFVLSFVIFLTVTGAAAVAALAWRDAMRMNWRRGIMLLFFPATCINAMTGQNGLLSAALMIGGFQLLEQRPALGGALLAALTYKPQLFPMVPVALVAARAWRALTTCCIGTVVLMLASAAVFGPQSWMLWTTQALGAGDPSLATWYAETFMRGYSIYVCATVAGLPEAAAWAAQVATTLLAAAAVWRAYRRSRSTDAKLAVLLTAAILATPHLQAYDMVMLAGAVVLLFSRIEDGPRLAEVALFASVWTLPLFRPWNMPSGRTIVPLVLFSLLAYAMVRIMRPQRTTATAVAAMSD